MNRRINWLDSAKGIAIIFVLIGHSIADGMRENNIAFNFLYTFIYTFHMPLLFFLSGYGFIKFRKDNDILGFVKKKVQSLLKPWIVYSILAYLVFNCISFLPLIETKLAGSTMGRMHFIQYLWKMICGLNPYCFHLWFIYVLFLVSISVVFISKYKTGKMFMLSWHCYFIYFILYFQITKTLSVITFYICVGIMLELYMRIRIAWVNLEL